MKTRSFAVVLPDKTNLDATVRALRVGATGRDIVAIHDPKDLGSASNANLELVFLHAKLIDQSLAMLREVRSTAKIAIFVEQTESRLLKMAYRNPRIVALLAWGEQGARPWELMYVARRMTAPLEPSPHMNQLLHWGATTVMWQPRTTKDERWIVTQIEKMCLRFGVERRVAGVVSTAAHELLMNAMYDAPVDKHGQVKYALDRRADLELLDEEIPTLRFTLDADTIALDAIDPHGRLPRTRFFEGVIRGHRNMTGEAEVQELDTSHGGAGLGLHTLYSSGSMLRAELKPLELTHVSWTYDRRTSFRQRRTTPRSLYFIPIISKKS